MFVDYDSELPPKRDHPWTISETNPNARYWDFKQKPESIRLVLEDFTPWSRYPAIPRFYELLVWLNGGDSLFESNDCGLRPPGLDRDAPGFIKHAFAADPLVIHGRLTIIFRDLAWNTSRPKVNAIKTAIHDGLRDHVRNIPAVVKIGEWEHFFTSIKMPGHAITLLFWAWGEDEDRAMKCLSATFEAVHACLKWISDGLKSYKSSKVPGEETL